MEVSRIENLPPPPGIISSIKAGFDAVAARVTAIFLPLLLNLLLWLGPRLRMEEMFKGMEADMVLFWQASRIPSEDIQKMLDMYERATQSINLFGLLRTLPIGISSLFAGQGASETPLGGAAVWQVDVITFPLWIMFLIFIGWVGGAFYFRDVAWAALAEKITSVRAFQAVLQTTLISILCNMILIAISVPVFLILAVAAQVSAVLANLVVLFIALGSVWVIVPMFFWAHGVFLDRQNALTSMLSSLQLTRFTLPTSSLFVLTIFLLSYGLNFLWRIPARDSWVTLLGIFGHSFVTTALLAGSFIYYHNMNAWVKAVLEKLRPNNMVKQA
ncbi:MAG: hypothetical protein IPG44_11890 [Anaerolineales bacterium]|jgi:hypothetical protein|nr:hypothetical protein [Anaerolineales bacterium]MCC6985534.1 hypothetical protein [Anaerolineales bacterium]